jgi:peptidoglycan/xylan/chitin deacetylase (PgdA/CDA1 family)
MQVFPAKTPEFVKALFPQFLWHVPSREKTLYLTFDDGPTPGITEWVLEQLSAYEAKATFFCIGNNMDAQPNIFKKIMDQGHAVGNHTYHHLKGWNTTTDVYLNDVERTQHLIAQATSSKLFRPPYGKFRISQAKQLMAKGYKIVLWDVLSYDWDRGISPEKCLKNVLEKASDGSIIVFHDSLKASQNLKYALPRILQSFSDQGYSFKAIAG